MKKSQVFITLIIGLSLLSLSACGKVTDKASEKVAEGIVEKATGANVDINSKGKDSISVQKDGVSIDVGKDLKWPKDKMGDIPEPTGKITAVLTDDKNAGSSVTFSGMTKEEGVKYIDRIKAVGFKEEMNLSAEDTLMFAGKKENGATANFLLNISTKEATIVYAQEK